MAQDIDNEADDRTLTDRQQRILDCIAEHVANRGYPPSVREIGLKVGLGSPSTVHAHLESLEKMGYIRRDPTKPRAIEVRHTPGVDVERRPARFVPLVGDVAAGTNVLANQEIEEMLPLPSDLTGEGGDLFMLRVRGDSMIDDAILDGDYVVARAQITADNNDIVVAGIPGEEATVKRFQRRKGKITLIPANPRLEPMEFNPSEVTVYGKVVTVLRRL